MNQSKSSSSDEGSQPRDERSRQHSNTINDEEKKSRRHDTSPAKDEERNSRRPSRVQSTPTSKCLGVFGLSANTTEDKISEIFGRYGKIKRINVIYDTKTGRSRGFCFIYYKHQSDARDAKDSCSGMEIDHRRIRVDYSITSRPHEPTPGVYKGRSTRKNPPYRGGTSHRRSRSRSRSLDQQRE